MKTADFDYELPPERIAQTPIEPRDASRLLVLDRNNNTLQHTVFYDLGKFLTEGDILILNQTRVIQARLFARKIPTGGQVELLLLRRHEPSKWLALVGGKGLVPGKSIQLGNGITGMIEENLGGARRLIHFSEPIDTAIGELGQIPLPPYIHKPLENPERYQTVYANQPGSVAAPTAGLHFTQSLIESLKERGVLFAEVTLHVGLDTFAPVTDESPEQHMIHTEWCQISSDTADLINRTRKIGKKIIAVGTTTVRTLETAARRAPSGSTVAPIEGATDLFILPGHQFKAVDALITNFHLPRSTLLMLVSAFCGRETVLGAYRKAVQAGYRFYSFGDAMLIV